jgi:hypothetical protein
VTTHVRPERTCIGCRGRDSSANLLRTVLSRDGAQLGVVPDPDRRAPGRGAHVHPVTECLDLAERRKAFPRAFKVQGPLTLSPVREYVERRSKESAVARPPATLPARRGTTT